MSENNRMGDKEFFALRRQWILTHPSIKKLLPTIRTLSRRENNGFLKNEIMLRFRPLLDCLDEMRNKIPIDEFRVILMEE
jgi:hypothetical protein